MCDSPHHAHEHPHPHPHLHDHGPADFRVVVTGKGGVGKTSLTAVLSRLFARDRWKVLAVDADPQMNLPRALGLSRAEARVLVPLSRNADYVEEKTGARPGGGWGGFLRLNPDVADVVDRHAAVAPDGVRLLVMGTLLAPATGCLCPENTLLAAVTSAVSLRRGEAIFLDTQAGVEHFGRALARGFHHAAVVTDPTSSGVQVAVQAARLARDLGIRAVHLVVNRARGPDDLARVRDAIDEEGGFVFDSEHALPWDAEVLAAEPSVGPILAPPTAFVRASARLAHALVHCEEALASCAS